MTRRKKTEVITFYNSSKFGVDVVIQMANQYTIKRSTRRWLLAIFFRIIDFAEIQRRVQQVQCRTKKILDAIYQAVNEKMILRQIFVVTFARVLSVVIIPSKLDCVKHVFDD